MEHFPSSAANAKSATFNQTGRSPENKIKVNRTRPVKHMRTHPGTNVCKKNNLLFEKAQNIGLPNVCVVIAGLKLRLRIATEMMRQPLVMTDSL